MLDSQTTIGVREGAVDTRARRRELTHGRILEAAWRLARRDGLAALVLRDLAAEVEMRAPSLYTYFPSKNDLYDAMYVQALRELASTIAAVPTGADPMDTLKRTVRAFARFCTDDACRYQLIFERPVPGFVPRPDSFAIGAVGLAKVAELAEATGVRGDRAFDLFRAVTTGIVTLQVANEPGGERWTRLVDEAVEMVVAHCNTTKRTMSKKGRTT